jgi:hypothetical protein
MGLSCAPAAALSKHLRSLENAISAHKEAGRDAGEIIANHRTPYFRTIVRTSVLSSFFDEYWERQELLYGVKQIYRTLTDGSLQPKAGLNQLRAVPQQDPLIDEQLDPWLAPWDGQPASCNSVFSRYFPN